MDVNLAAAAEIARQLRLRDMGGIIVIDFIDLHKSENRTALVEKMREMMANDRAKHTILPLSKFGLMQITRQRVRPETHIDMRETCPACHGTGLVTPAALLDKTDRLLREREKTRLHQAPSQSGRSRLPDQRGILAAAALDAEIPVRHPHR